METDLARRTGGSPNDRWVIAGPFTSIHDRDELLDDLEQAVETSARPSVLVVFGFERLKERLEAMLEPDGNVLLGRIARRLVDSTDDGVLLYESRRGEFCGLFTGETATLDSLLAEIRRRLDEELHGLGIHTTSGVVALPGEATEPIAALELADRRCRQVAGDLRPPLRPSISTRIAEALHASMSVDGGDSKRG